ncbi:MAG: NYN domain-containing protein [Planctomycetota bacterium]|nr:MAG: NYN domain-containing protein [Planctomycetota bacterium]
MSEAPVYVLVDGENVDRTLGQILEGKPRPEQRPRWDRVRQFAEKTYGKPARALFFLNASRGLPGTFVQALRLAGFVPIPLVGSSDQKVVDMAILRTLEALAKRPGDVLLVSHDNDFRDAFAACAASGRRLGVLGFTEYLSGDYFELKAAGSAELFDLEDDAEAFEGGPLPRVRAIPIERFDPLRFL